jgi:hypothetical protein
MCSHAVFVPATLGGKKAKYEFRGRGLSLPRPYGGMVNKE